MGNLQGGELVLLVVLALVILGPERLPEYAAKLARLVRSLRSLAEGAKSQLKEEMGPAFEEVNWQQLDPRQYDPRRIVREALSTSDRGRSGSTRVDPADGGRGGAAASTRAGAHADRSVPTPRTGARHDPDRPTPFDLDAT